MENPFKTYEVDGKQFYAVGADAGGNYGTQI